MTDQPLPETIPAGEYVLAEDRDGFRLTLVWMEYGDRHPVVATSASGHREGTWLPSVQARHLLAMPGRPHDDRLDGKRTVDRSHWTDRLPGDLYPRLHAPSLDECWCSRVPGAVHPDPGRVHWTEAQRQPGEKRGMRRPETDGGYWYGAPCVDERGLELVGTLEWQPIAPDGTVPVERES